MLPFMRDGLADVDGCRHIAMAVIADGEPIGIADSIAVRDCPAETAVEVSGGLRLQRPPRPLAENGPKYLR
jgi:hypothetical protein